MQADPGFCSGGTIEQLAEAAGELAAVTAIGVLTYQTVQNLNQDQESYATPALEEPGATVLTEPLPQAPQATTTAFPLTHEEPNTSIPPATGVYNPTLSVTGDPLLQSQSASDLVVKSNTQTPGATINVPNLDGLSVEEATQVIEGAGYTYHSTSKGGYIRFRHSDGSEIYIRTNGEIMRLGPKYQPDPNKAGYHPRYNDKGELLTDHHTGEYVKR
jgi:hypothetical protein